MIEETKKEIMDEFRGRALSLEKPILDDQEWLSQSLDKMVRVTTKHFEGELKKVIDNEYD